MPADTLIFLIPATDAQQKSPWNEMMDQDIWNTTLLDAVKFISEPSN